MGNGNQGVIWSAPTSGAAGGGQRWGVQTRGDVRAQDIPLAKPPAPQGAQRPLHRAQNTSGLDLQPQMEICKSGQIKQNNSEVITGWESRL